MRLRTPNRTFAAANSTAIQTASCAPLVLAAFVGSLWPAAASAQTTETEEVVVTAPLEGSRIESLQGAAIMTRDDIVENLNGGLGDTLDAQPGVTTTFFGAGASRPIIRGLGDDRIRVLENGIGAIDASAASPDHAVTADGLDAQRIEVLRGSAALAYGGNAIGGVVNVIDESIPTHRIEGVEGDLLAAYSIVDQGTQGSASVAAGAGAFAFRLSAAARETDDYEIPGFSRSAAARATDPLPPGDEPSGEAPNSWTSFRAYALGGSVVQDWGYVGLAVKHTTDDYGLFPEEFPGPGGHIELEQTRVEARGDFRIDVGPFNRFDFGVQHADYEHTEFEGDGAPGTTFTSEGWEGRVEAHHRGLSSRLSGAVGLQAVDTDFAAFGDEAFITPTNTRDMGAFIVERYDTGRWGLEGGLRLERRELDNEGGGAREFDTVSASGGVFFRPAQNWFLGGTVARTERAPTAIELFAEGPHLATENFERGDPNLDSEQALSFELSARYETDPLRFEVNVYRIDFTDYIALVDSGIVFWFDEGLGTEGFDPPDPAPIGAETLPVFTFVQRDATFTGGEISARARLFETTGFTVSADAALDLVRADFDGGGHPPRIPPMSATVGLEAENDHWRGRVEVLNVGEQDRLDELEAPTDGYTFVNASLAFHPFEDNDRLTLRLDGRNLTDEEGRVHASFLKDVLPLPGRSVRFTIAASF